MRTYEFISAPNTRSSQYSNVSVPNGMRLRIAYASLATQMFQAPAVITMTIAATRMHRSLTDYTSSPDMCAIHHFALLTLIMDHLSMRMHSPASGLNFATPKQPHATQIPLSPMEITVCTVFEQHRTPRLGRHDSSISTDKAVREKTNTLSLDQDVESCN